MVEVGIDRVPDDQHRGWGWCAVGALAYRPVPQVSKPGNPEGNEMVTELLADEWVDQMESLSKEVKAAARNLKAHEARYLVDTYYEIQDQRKRTTNQQRAVEGDGEVPVLAEWLARQSATLENNVKKLLQGYAEANTVGQWSLSQVGVGPVIAAGLLAHIDISKAATVGAIWRFAGLDPSVEWGKGEKRPWNAKLKVLCWKMGDSFVKNSNRETCIYGHIYRERKAMEVDRNERKLFSDQAAASLESKKFKESDTKARYKAGMLPDGRLDLRARRYAVKLFLSHWHHVAFESAYGMPPPKPYILTRDDHTHYLAPPNWPMA
jgi:hypothetical protein